MKRYIFILTIAVSAFFTSCKQETLPIYSGVDQIFFSYADPGISGVVIDSSLIKFGYDKPVKPDSTISLGVTVQGSITDYDRPVKFILVEPVSTAKLGQDVELLLDKSFVPAGKETGTIYIKLKNTEILADTSFTAYFSLVENEHFKTDFHLTTNTSVNNKIKKGESKINSTIYHIRFDAIPEDVPRGWVYSMIAGGRSQYPFNGIFGTNGLAPPSAKKFWLLCEIIPGFTPMLFTPKEGQTDAQWYSAIFQNPGSAVLASWNIVFSQYLAEEKKNGRTVYEEDGITEMTAANY